MQIGPYTAEDEIARGAMGVVLRGRDPEGRAVALKVLLGGRNASPEELTRFRQEAEIVARMHHPGIVRLLSAGQSEHGPYLALELIEGRSLEAMIREQGALPWRQAAQIARTLALALEHAHQLGILHRDVKPSNVLVDPTGAPKLTDFGLGRLITLQGLTRSGDLLGTPAYMPPEQALGERANVGAHSDVFSLGATLYFMLTGRPPFLGIALDDILDKVLNEDPPSIRSLKGEGDPALEAICTQCLEKEPGDRYISAAALAEDLERYLTTEPSKAASPRSAPGLLIGLAACVLLAVVGAAAASLSVDATPSKAPVAAETPVSPASAPEASRASAEALAQREEERRARARAGTIRRVEEQLARGDTAGASAALATLTSVPPLNATTLLLRARLREAQGERVQALRDLLAARRLGADDAVSAQLRALYPDPVLRRLAWITLLPTEGSLEEAALLASKATLEPDLDVAATRARLDTLAERIRPRIEGRAGPARLVALLDESYGVASGNTESYGDLRNSCLHCTIERGRGLQITCCLLLIALGERLAVPLEGVCFPQRFLARSAGPPTAYVDAFMKRILAPEHLPQMYRQFPNARTRPYRPSIAQPSPRQEILVRLLHFLASRYRSSGDSAGLQRAADALRAVAPRNLDRLVARAFGEH